MKRYLDVLENVARHVRNVLIEHQLEVTVGSWLDSAVLKVQKRTWANEGDASWNAGIFFSVWVEESGIKRNRAFYNIHALRLRSLGAYSIESREFAAAFRSEFASHAADWPNVSIDYGPQTLMQGWIDLDDPQFEETVIDLVRRFVPVARIIDALLNERTRS